LKRIFITARTPIDCISRCYVLAGRLLLLFTAILLVAMPWTEYFWHFDRFLFGGQDFEFGLLLLAAFLSLILVLLHHGKRDVHFLLTAKRWLSFAMEHAAPTPSGDSRHLLVRPYLVPLPSPALQKYNLPLQV
jgi:hypothetical protein